MASCWSETITVSAFRNSSLWKLKSVPYASNAIALICVTSNGVRSGHTTVETGAAEHQRGTALGQADHHAGRSRQPEHRRTGHDHDEIGLLIFPSLAGLRSLCPELGAEARLEEMVGHRAVRAALLDGLARHNVASQGSSMRIARCMLMTEPPSIDADEITDKGYLNQRAVLAKRAALVERLHRRPVPDDVIEIEGR